jgi:hypothetical protein
MKKVFFVAILATTSFISYGQNDFISDTLFTSKVSDIDYAKQYKNNEKFSAIQLEDGSILKVGDVVTLGRPSGLNTTKQVNSGLFSGNVTTTNTFQYILNGRIGLSAMAGMQYLPQGLQGSKVTIKEIKGSHTSLMGSRNSPLAYWLILDYGPGVATVLNIPAAITNGEFINPNAAMTRDQAIAKLKEQKDLLDLGMITKEQFEKIKLDLTSIIMKVS